MVENRSLEEETMEDNMTSVMRMPDYVMQSKMVLEGVLLPIMAAFGFLGEFVVCAVLPISQDLKDWQMRQWNTYFT